MHASATAAEPSSRRALRAILTAGLVAGLLDGLDAVVFIGWIRGVPVARIFQFIASGAVGLRAFHMGAAGVALGVFFHFVIATGAAAAFYVLSRKWTALLDKPFVWGPIYGFGVFLFMRYVVVSLSATPHQPPSKVSAILNLIFSHVFFVGIPIALITRHHNAG